MIHGATKCQEWEGNPNRPCVEAQFFLPKNQISFHSETFPKPSLDTLSVLPHAFPLPRSLKSLIHIVDLLQVWPTCPWRLGFVMRCNAGVSSMDSQSELLCSYARQIWGDVSSISQSIFFIIFPILL